MNADLKAAEGRSLASAVPGWRQVKRELRSPKGTLLLLFVPLLVLGIQDAGAGRVLPGLLTGVAAAAVIDVFVLRSLRRRWVFPDGAILSALIVAMLVSPLEPWYVVAAASVLAVTSKNLFRVGPANIFNPAALAIVVMSVRFGTVEDWWGALPSFGYWGALVVLALGLFIADRVNKTPMVLAFFGAYFTLFTAASLAGDGSVAEVFRTPDIQAVLFFTLFMLDDPPTSPARYRHQVAYSLIAAAACFAFFELYGWVYYLPAGLLVANGAEGARRWIAARQRQTRTVPRRRPA